MKPASFLYKQVARHRNLKVGVNRVNGQPVSRGWSANRGTGTQIGAETGDPTGTLAPEQCLLTAIIARAWQDALTLTDKPRRGRYYSTEYVSTADRVEAQEARDEARRWFASDTIEPFSFVWCCLYLPYSRVLVADIRRRVLEAKPLANYSPPQLTLFPPYKKGTP